MRSDLGPDRDTDLPGGLVSMWRLCRLGFGFEPRLMGLSIGLALIAALPDALMAWWLALVGRGVIDGDRTLVRAGAIGLAVSGAGTWLLALASARVQRRFRDKVTISLESHVARLQATVVTIAHQERPELLDRLSVLRDQVFVLDHMYMSVFSTAGWILRLGVTLGLLVAVHPALVVLALFGLPPALVAAWRPGRERAVEEAGAAGKRLATHLFRLAAEAPSGKEVRVLGLADRLVTDRRRAWESWYGPVAVERRSTAVWNAAAWGLFASAYVACVAFVGSDADAAPADVVLVLAAGARLSAYVGATVGEIGFLRGIWMDGARRLAWLEDYAEAQTSEARSPAPNRIERSIRFDGVTFAYPGASRPAVEAVDLELPAGAVVAIVGENGAGKSTLVKLLTRMYLPDHGRILVDDVDLASIDPAEWRSRAAGAFQDFARLEFLVRQTVGLGDVDRIDDPAAVAAATGRAGADDVVDGFPSGFETQLGPSWPDGIDVSFGQWQRLALARGFMRDAPLLLVLDEPTAALDAEAEHILFERYAEQAGAESGNGRITILVSHRFSTVRMADLIVVVDGAHVVEVGSHDELLAAGGQYADLYRIQADAYS